ncbi:MAG: MFS transporter [Gammaproteobacteria bacterium]|jgi:PAT family beta-lactamase induction signal transducer AmpG
MLPNLGSSRRVRFFAFTSFYVAQGLPIGLITVALPAWLASNGTGAGDVANFVAITSLPWAFKLFAGPIMDRFRFPTLGSRRPWVMLAQGGLVASLFGLAVLGGSPSELSLLITSCFVINCFAAVQDVAVDGMAIEVLPADERGRANALMAFGQVAGFSGAGALCGWTLTRFGLSGTALFLALGTVIILAIAVALREREGEKLLPWSDGAAHQDGRAHEVSWRAICVNIFRVLILPASLVLILVTLLWRISHGIFVTAAPVILTQELGWELSDYTNWASISSFVAAIIGILVGPYIDRHGSRAIQSVGLIFCGLIFLSFWLTTDWWSNRTVWIVGLFAANLGLQIAFITLIAIHMTICWGKVAATQFAIYMAWANLARSIGAKLYGELSPYLELGQESLLMALLFLLGAALLALVNLKRHQESLNRMKAAEPTEDVVVDIPARY